MNISAIILAGGKSSRMNYNNKALLLWNGKSFLEILIAELSDIADEILISQHEKQPDVKSAYNIVNDKFPGCGPLSGMEAGLLSCKNEKLIVAACDMPMVNVVLFKLLLCQLEDYDAVIPVVNGRIQPLAAIYCKRILTVVQDLIHHQVYRVRELLNRINVKYVDINDFGLDAKILDNINTLEEYHCFLKSQGEWDGKNIFI